MAFIAGLAYVLLGRFPVPPTHVQAWRLATWVASAMVLAGHVAYLHFRRSLLPARAALQAALGVAIGGFGLALWGAINALTHTAAVRPNWILALILWPLFTAVPAFIIAYVGSVLLQRIALAKPRPRA